MRENTEHFVTVMAVCQAVLETKKESNQSNTVRGKMQKGQFVKKKFKDMKMDILGKMRVIPELELTLNADGAVTMSFDEYNRIANNIHETLREQRKVR